MEDLNNVNLESLVEFAEAYNDIGGAVQEQLRDLLDGAEDGDLNPNAVNLIGRALGEYHKDIKELCTEYLSTNC